MTIEELLKLKEGENYEFKEAKRHFEFDRLAQYGCSLSNEGGGRVILGISDKRPRVIVGSLAFDQPERTRRGLIDLLHIKVDFEQLEENGKRVLVFIFAGRPIGLPVQVNGIAWWRDGDSLVPMPPEELRSIYAESAHDFSADICPGATLSDLDKTAVELFRDRWIDKTHLTRLKTLSQEQLLRDCEAVLSDGITYAALILFGKHDSLGRYLAQSETIFEYRASDASGPAQQREEYREGFFLYYDKLWRLINIRNDKQHYQDGLFVFDIPTFNERVVREAILNAICHRNYQLCGSVFVRQYRDRLVIDSPGGLLPGITLQNILDRQAPRNRRIAELLEKCGLVERSGQGMNLIYEFSIREAKPLPDFSGTDSDMVRLALNGLILDKDMLVLINKIGSQTMEHFSTEDFLIINLIARGEGIPQNLRTHLPRLLELGIIERAGRGKFIFARKYYAYSGKAGVHTRLSGLDKDYNKGLIFKHIVAQNSTGTPFGELQQILPSHSRDQIRTLLENLRDSGNIYMTGERRGALWFPVDGTKERPALSAGSDSPKSETKYSAKSPAEGAKPIVKGTASDSPLSNDRKEDMGRVLENIIECKEHGISLKELGLRMPLLSRERLKRLVAALHRNGKIRMTGVTRGARWFPADGLDKDK